MQKFKIGDEVSGTVSVYVSEELDAEDAENNFLPVQWSGKIAFIDTKGNHLNLPYLVQVDLKSVNHLPIQAREEFHNEIEAMSYETLKSEWEDFETNVPFPEHLDKDGNYQWFQNHQLEFLTDEIRVNKVIRSIYLELNA